MTNSLGETSFTYGGTIHGKLYLPQGWTRITMAHSPENRRVDTK